MIIKLETAEQDLFSIYLVDIMEDVIDNENEIGIKFLRGLWDDESWESIKEKFAYEDATWYVWWMDGVNALMASEVGKDNG